MKMKNNGIQIKIDYRQNSNSNHPNLKKNFFQVVLLKKIQQKNNKMTNNYKIF